MKTRAGSGTKSAAQAVVATPRRKGENRKTVKQLDREEKERKRAEKDQKVHNLKVFEEEEAEHAASAAQTPVNGRKILPRQVKAQAKTTVKPHATKKDPKPKGKAAAGSKTSKTATADAMEVDPPMDSSAGVATQGGRGSQSKGTDVVGNPGAPVKVGTPEDAMDVDGHHAPGKKRPRVVQIITVSFPLYGPTNVKLN